MATELEIIWNEFKKHCVETATGDDEDNGLSVYLDICQPVSLETGLLKVEVPTIFSKKKIDSMFMPQMKKAFEDTGFGLDIAVQVSSELKPEVEARREPPAPPQQTAPPRVTTMRSSAIQNNGLNPNYVFSTFVVGKSNILAHGICMDIAVTPGQKYNPLFIWGKVGLGKTHLMHAIGHYVEEHQPDKKVLYVSSEKFTNDFISAIRTNKTAEFRARYRDLDLLMIDDIQFLYNKEGTQEEFFHTFNDLKNANKQIVISSDRPPKEIKDVEERLVSRFTSGIITDIQPPDFETRVAILQKKAELKHYNIPEEINHFIAQNVPSNIRELEGALNRVVACSEFSGEAISIDNVTVWLKDIIHDNHTGNVSIGLIQQLVSEAYGYSIEDLLSQNRTAELATARQVAMYLAREKTEESLQQIGRAFNKKDHTTVIHACRKIEELIKTDVRVKNLVDNVVSKL